MNTDGFKTVRNLTITYETIFEVMSKEALASVPLVLRALHSDSNLSEAKTVLSGVYGFYRAFYNIANHIIATRCAELELDHAEFLSMYGVLESDCKVLKELFGTAEIAIDTFSGAMMMESEENIRRKNLEDIDAILANEGFSPDGCPDWYKELKVKYIRGEIASEEMTKQVLEKL